MGELDFEHPSTIDPNLLRVAPFKVESKDVQNFDCGSAPLNDFLRTEEVRNYERLRYGRTYLVYYEFDLVAYFTISSGEIRASYLAGTRIDNIRGEREFVVEKIPGVKIGRLAVDKKYQNRGVGRAVVAIIAGIARQMSESIGMRLLIVQAKPESMSFYRKMGFNQLVSAREKRRIHRTFFLDLYSIGKSEGLGVIGVALPKEKP